MNEMNDNECNQVALPLSALIFCLLLSLYRDFEKVAELLEDGNKDIIICMLCRQLTHTVRCLNLPPQFLQ